MIVSVVDIKGEIELDEEILVWVLDEEVLREFACEVEGFVKMRREGISRRGKEGWLVAKF